MWYVKHLSYFVNWKILHSISIYALVYSRQRAGGLSFFDCNIACIVLTRLHKRRLSMHTVAVSLGISFQFWELQFSPGSPVMSTTAVDSLTFNGRK